ncbi:ArsC/Spx/MgsR family protein [Methylocucumis oryzae]|uniref:Nitrogenase-associated protein n=1 Tax=Methylocucumis oryzae TaxID=1632867 RepID=A0A0F3IEL6_9GAMM|nr:ArsC/Spx/MgsR family protein [Methylocucumis oryzae]KJV05191.1 nitrogenase-associated protein [Methylocucumis oryzae]
MATVYFYEKPGCVSNTRQKKMLAAAGHKVIAKNLLTEAWQAEQLRAFFGKLPVTNWFNYSAPMIKLGHVQPELLSETQALALMVDTPLLIRRPLMQVGHERLAGFDQELVDTWIGLTEIKPEYDLEACPKMLAQASCGYD